MIISELQDKMEEGIQKVLSGKIKSFKYKGIYPFMVDEYMTSIGWEKGELETNGWQYDWWLFFRKDGKSYTAFGSGYYGDFKFNETEENNI